MKCKCIAYFLVLLLVFQTMSFSGINVYSAKEDSANSCAVRLLTALNIMELDDDTGRFWDENPVKRSVMAKIICRMFAYDAVVDNVPRFDDVAEADRAYVETVVRCGHMLGYNNEKFGPEDHITGEQLVKIFVCLLGAGGLAEDMGGYPMGYIKAARKLGIVDNEFNCTGEIAKRIDVANIIYSTLNAEILQLNSISGVNYTYNTVEGETFLTENLDIYRIEGIINKNDATSLSRAEGMGNSLIEINGKSYKDENYLADDFLGCNVNLYIKKAKEDKVGKVIYVEENKNNKIVDIDGNNNQITVSDDRNVVYYNGNNTRTLKLSLVANMIYNGKSITLDMTKIKDENCFVRFIDNDNNGEFDVVIVKAYRHCVVEKTDIDDEKIFLRYGEKTLDVKESFLRVTKDGEKAQLEDIGIGEVLLVAVSGEEEQPYIEIKASTQSVMGNVKSIYPNNSKSKKYASIADGKYEISPYALSLAQKGKLSELKAGETGRFYLDSNGVVVYYSLDKPGEKVGYMIEYRIKDESFSSTFAVRICTVDKSIEEFTSDDYILFNGIHKKIADISSDMVLTEKLSKPQLITYQSDDGKIKKINFANEGYDKNCFSLDVEKSMTCTSTSVLDDKYFVSNETVLFYVPNPSGLTYESVKFDVGRYHLLSGSWFGQNGVYQLKLYDIMEDGLVKYAVYMKDYRWSQISEGEPWIAVSEVRDQINAQGELVKVICAYNEAGNIQEFEVADSDILNAEIMSVDVESKMLKGTGIYREVKAGDVAQFHVDSKAKLDEIKIICSPDKNTEYFLPTYMNDSVNCKTKIVYGEVMRGYSDHILVSCKPVWDDMTPLDADKYIADTGNAVYEYNCDRGKFTPIEFSDIDVGDKVFACVNGANRTRILVVYR